jgi:hypothetical protein
MQRKRNKNRKAILIMKIHKKLMLMKEMKTEIIKKI